MFSNVGKGTEEPKGNSDSMLAEVLEMNKQVIKQNSTIMAEHGTVIQNQAEALKNLERHVGEMAEMFKTRKEGELPSNTVLNPGHSRQFAKAVQTRSCSSAEIVKSVEVDEDEEPLDEEREVEVDPRKVQGRRSPASTAQPRDSSKTVKKPPVKAYKPQIPYPGRLKMEKEDVSHHKFLSMLRQLHINIPFVEALSTMPKYAKFLKDMLTNKTKLEEFSHVVMNERCSSVIEPKIPQKVQDPGNFTVPCVIGGISIGNSLADLGASINLMPYTVFKKLGLGELQPTRMSLLLADRTVKYPRGLVENMLVRVDKFIFPVDFVILDMDEEDQVPIILGRPFLATAHAMIDVYGGKLTLEVNDERVTFDVHKSMKHPGSQDDTLYFLDTIMSYVGHCLSEICGRDASETQILDNENQEIEMTVVAVEQDPSLLASKPPRMR